MNIIVPPDNVRSNIFYSANEQCDGLPFQSFMQRRPALAMMAAMVADIIEVQWDIPREAFSVHMLETPPNISMQIRTRDMPRKMQARMDGFIRLMGDVALEDPDSFSWSDKHQKVTGRSERGLLHYLQNMVQKADIPLGLSTTDDPQQHHLKSARKGSWQDVAISGLQKAWLLTTLPERAYLGETDLLHDAYIKMHSVSFGFDRIEAMVRKSEQDSINDDSAKMSQPPRSLIFYYH